MSLWHPSIVARRVEEGGYVSDYVRAPGQPEEPEARFALPERPSSEHPPHPALAQAFLGLADE